MPRLEASETTAQRILRATRTVEQMPRSKQGRLRKSLLPHRTNEFGKCGTAITAMSTGGTAGSGAVTIYTMTTAGVTTATTIEVTAYNLSLDAVSSGAWLQLQWNERSHKWLVSFEDCGTTS